MENGPSQLPSNTDVEQAFLSILLNKNQALEELTVPLKAEHFYHPAHQKIFYAIVTLVAQNQLADPLTVGHYIEKDLHDVGGKTYLMDLAKMLIALTLGSDYAQQIYDLALRRQLIELADKMSQGARKHGFDDLSVYEHISQTEQTLFQMSMDGLEQRGFLPFHQILSETLKSAEAAHKNSSHVVGVTTGLLDLDKKLGGLYPSDLIVLAGRPSMGKTALATNMALNAARAWHLTTQKEGACVGFFSLEMSSEQLALRLLSQESQLASESIRRGAISHQDFAHIVHASQSLSALQLFIDDTPGLTISTMQARARRMKRKHNIGLIVVDYLQLIRAPKRISDGRVQELSEITRQLKILAKELNVPVLALSQLSRAVEQREDKRPLLSDLRESGSIEQDADVVMFVYRPDYYQMRDSGHVTQSTHQAEVIIAKQRHGSLGTVKLHFQGQFTQFSNAVAAAPTEDSMPSRSFDNSKDPT